MSTHAAGGAAITDTGIDAPMLRRGKVREVYACRSADGADELLLVATDRISAFDVVLPTPIPGKGRVLTGLSAFWFERLAGLTPHHLLGVIRNSAPPPFDRHAAMLSGRAMRCVRTEVIPIEFVVRGYLAGSGWKDYQRTGRVCGVELPPGLRQCDRLPRPIFTPATKADSGHDENISFEQAAAQVGGDVMRDLRDRAVRLYESAAAHAAGCGIIIADTKFEFGRGPDGALLLIDEALTPDSSRFWPADRYQPGREQESFDKQFVRNYLEELVARGQWNKTPPGPELPPEVVAGTVSRYREAQQRLTGRDFN